MSPATADKRKLGALRMHSGHCWWHGKTVKWLIYPLRAGFELVLRREYYEIRLQYGSCDEAMELSRPLLTGKNFDRLWKKLSSEPEADKYAALRMEVHYCDWVGKRVRRGIQPCIEDGEVVGWEAVLRRKKEEIRLLYGSRDEARDESRPLLGTENHELLWSALARDSEEIKQADEERRRRLRGSYWDGIGNVLIWIVLLFLVMLGA